MPSPRERKGRRIDQEARERTAEGIFDREEESRDVRWAQNIHRLRHPPRKPTPVEARALLLRYHMEIDLFIPPIIIRLPSPASWEEVGWLMGGIPASKAKKLAWQCATKMGFTFADFEV